MTIDDGEYAIRNRKGWGGRSAVDEPVSTSSKTRPDD